MVPNQKFVKLFGPRITCIILVLIVLSLLILGAWQLWTKYGFAF